MHIILLLLGLKKYKKYGKPPIILYLWYIKFYEIWGFNKESVEDESVTLEIK